MVSTRAEIITRRTYNRPKGDDFESWEETIDRVILHQQWLWERAKGSSLNDDQKNELQELRSLFLVRKALPAGRTLWLGGTEIIKRREVANFNCAFLHVKTIHDVVDAFWLLLQGCGAGFTPKSGALNGFSRRIDQLNIVYNPVEKGRDTNREEWWPDKKEWYIEVGDSAEAWAKSLGKIMAGKYPAKRLTIDFSQVRLAGTRLKGYGWISQGHVGLQSFYTNLFDLMNRRAGQMLTAIDILDIINMIGTVLSTRRSAQIALYPFGGVEQKAFTTAKNDLTKNPHRVQSNNSLMFYEKPLKKELKGLMETIYENGGSEPGLYNMEAAKVRAPYAQGTNPCGEILLGNNSLCNLVDINVGAFGGDVSGLHRATYLMARANYRQTCVDLRDGVLQSSWHENNQFLRLCGVGLTGIARRPDLEEYDLKRLRVIANYGAMQMADELHMPYSHNVTTIKPAGTSSKIMDTTEGIHRPLGKYIFNNVNFSKMDPLVERLIEADYMVWENPYDKTGMLVRFPVKWDDIKFERINGLYVNKDSALKQLDLYKKFMDNYVDHNASITISYDEKELDDIANWLYKNWNSYVGVSFILRNDPTKSAKDLGYEYLPQEVVTEEEYEAYARTVKPITISGSGEGELDVEECAGGVCPVR